LYKEVVLLSYYTYILAKQCNKLRPYTIIFIQYIHIAMATLTPLVYFIFSPPLSAAVMTVSLRTTPPTSKKSPRNDMKFTKSVDMCAMSQSSMDESEEELLVTEVPKIRRFTLADPLLMPLT